MTNKKITDLVELTTPTTDDVFPLVDIATNSTKKAQLANLPISTATQTALDAKQATLVSGTNIKTINSTSLLGSGNISIAANPAGTAGQIQFNSGSAFTADSNLYWDNTNKRLGVGTATPTSKLQVVTDDATNPQAFSNQTSILAGTASQGALISAFSSTNGGYVNALWPGNAWYKMNYGGTNHNFSVGGTVTAVIDSNTTFGNGTTSLGARLGIKGSGSTSATTSLLVQNSSGTNWLQVKDDGDITNGANGSTDLKFEFSPVANKFFRLTRQGTTVDFYAGNGGNALIETSGGQPFSLIAASSYLTLSNGGVSIGATLNTTNASAILDVTSTTKGFLPPRMTTTQKNAISSPAAGLVVYDTDTNKLCCYNGTSWNDLF